MAPWATSGRNVVNESRRTAVDGAYQVREAQLDLCDSAWGAVAAMKASRCAGRMVLQETEFDALGPFSARRVWAVVHRDCEDGVL
jgi:hypothetical protein